jgi:hypothetical protein
MVAADQLYRRGSVKAAALAVVHSKCGGRAHTTGRMPPATSCWQHILHLEDRNQQTTTARTGAGASAWPPSV